MQYQTMGMALKRIIAVSSFSDQEQARAARWLKIALSIIIVSLLVAIITLFVDPLPPDLFISLMIADGAGLIIALGVWFLAQRGLVRLAASLLIITLFILTTYGNVISSASIQRPAVIIYIAMIPLVGLLLGRRSMNLFAALCAVMISMLYYSSQLDAVSLSSAAKPRFNDLIMLLLLITTNTILLNVSIRRAEEKADDIRQTAAALALVNGQLQASQAKLQQAQAELEQRVEQRTEDLSYSNTKLQAEIVERQRAQDQLAYDTVHDALTGLPNRVLLMDRLQHASALAKRHANYRFAVLFLDLDYFKVVNDSLGHIIGDQLLISLAHRLGTCLHRSDTLARLSGDEFVLLIEAMEDVQGLIHKVCQIREKLKLPFSLDGHQVVVSASIGIVADAQNYEQPEDVLRDADIAMYQAKRLGKSRFEIFKPHMREQALARLALETDLRYALENRELELYYQPIVSLPAEQITGFEALLRWRSPTRGIVSPLEFITLAEEIGLIIPIGRWILHEACRQLHEWQARFPRKSPLTISVNISGRQFCAPDFSGQVATILQAVGLDANSLKLEITEGIWLNSSLEVTAIFRKLNDMGIQFHIDDFGTGYSSLSYLQDFPIRAIKIDRAFVGRMGDDGNHTEIVRAVITMAHELGMEAVAEGVETVEQLAQLKAIGCDYGQGYLLSPPVDKATIEGLLTAPLASGACQQPTTLLTLSWHQGRAR